MPNSKLKKLAKDYTYQLQELSGSQRQLRIAHLAAELHRQVRLSDGEVNREDAIRAVAARLGTTEREVRIGIVLGEGTGLFTRSSDGLLLQAA